MAAASSGLSIRTLCNLIKTTPHNLLPQTTPCLLSILNNCGPVLSRASTGSQGGNKNSTDSGVLVHKYATQITSLLHDKSFEARWTAVVLIKTTVELGGWEVLRNCEPWVRGLLSLLGKRDPPTTHELAVVTLTKIYLLVQPYQTLRREITSPTLPSFISSCLLLVNSGPSTMVEKADFSIPLLPTVLGAFRHLLPHHPTIFRPFIAQLESMISPLIAPAPSLTPSEHGGTTRVVSSKCSAAAQHLKVLLPCCAPKNTAGEVWARGLKDNISEIHHTANQIFRAIIEDWEPTSTQAPSGSDPNTFGETVSDAGRSIMGLPKWTGIDAGVERLKGLLGILRKYLSVKSAALTSIPLGLIMDMLTRIFSLTAPSEQNSTTWHGAARVNSQIGRDERESLFARLPQIHVQGIELLLVLSERLKESFSPMVQGCLDQIRWVFIAESYDADLRTATYTVLAKFLDVAGGSLSKASVSPLSRLLKSCCHDLLPHMQGPSETPSTSDSNRKIPKKKNGNSNLISMNADSFLSASTAALLSENKMSNAGLREAAELFLTSTLYNIPSHHLSLSLRSVLDRTAILSQLKLAILASVLNPPAVTESGRSRNSIIPHLARSYPGHIEVEGLLRPRMPIIPTGKGLLSENHEDDDDEDEILENVNSRGEDEARNSETDTAETRMDRLGMLLKHEEGPPKERVLFMTGQSPQHSLPPLATQQPEGSESIALTQKRTIDEDDLTKPYNPLPNPNTQFNLDGPPSPKRSRMELASLKTSTPAAVEPNSRPLSAKDQGISWEAPPRVSRSSSQQAVTAQNFATSAATPGHVGDEDSDDDFEIPEIVMDADTDDEETMPLTH